MKLKKTTLEKVEELIERYPALAVCREDLRAAVLAICESYAGGHKLLVCGNGGSAADSEHIVGELMKGFLLPRKLGAQERQAFERACPASAAYLMENLQGTLPAISLVNSVGLGTAFANDQAPDLVFAQQVFGLGAAGDVLIAISTSGSSRNVLYALDVARAKGLRTIALTGAKGGRMAAEHLAETVIRVPATETFKIQEYHLPVYHMLCIAAEHEFFGD
ncbi:SIS domain-containing protein [Selenomonas bovis]|uniref:SIS domain-containing protein n=1 Tax=Selenomonas bovis TaxID=416586 RepID=A0A848B571_9FIRM|nr:SIS domain-containing protein [Selenomonas bovis]NMD99053.1 SIS domain-containing protein [Selenomonas bovis]